MDLGVVIALKEEFDLFFQVIRKLCEVERDKKTGDVFYLFNLASEVPHKPYRCVASFVGRMGPTEAALMTQQMITNWDPKNVVMLGLAAGISKDVRLGDIIVADSVDSYTDRARMGDAHGIEFSGQVYQCSAELVRFVDNFKFTNTTLHDRWRKRCSESLRRTISKQKLEELTDAGLASLKPTYHIGPLASGPFVLASSSFREQLLKRNRILMGVEMEAGGMMATIRKQMDQQRSLVIRGISDYGDERKSETDAIGAGTFRRYAMNNAVRLLLNLLAANALPFSDAGGVSQRNADFDDEHSRPATPPKIRFVHSYSLPRTWADRDQDLNELADAIRGDDHRVISLVAIGGTGKSAIVRKLIDELSQRDVVVDGCLWFSFYIESNLDRFLTETCRHLIPHFDPQEYPSPFAKSALIRESLNQQRHLIILDGIEMMLVSDRDSPRYGAFKHRVLRDLIVGACSNLSKSFILMTSRWSPTDLTDLTAYKELSLADLSSDSALNYMLQQGVKGDAHRIRQVCAHYGHHALTLKILADWLTQPPHTGDISGVDNLEQLPAETPQGEKLQSILESYWKKLTLPERFFMTRLSAFRTGVTETAFKILAVDDTGEACHPNHPIFYRTLLRLKQSALLQIETQDNVKIYTAHPLIKAYFYDRLNEEERQNTHLALIDYARGLPVPDQPLSRQQLEPLVELFHQCMGAGLWREAADLFRPNNKLGLHLYEWGHLDEELEMLESLLHHGNTLASPSDYALISNLWAAAGLVYRKTGKLKRADQCFSKAIAIDKQNDDIQSEAIHWTQRSYTHAYMGRYKRALAMVKRGFDLDDQIGNQKNKPIQLGWIGAFLTALGQSAHALRFLNESIKVSQEQSPPNIRHECHSLIRRGDLHLFTLEYEKAIDSYQQALNISRTPRRRQLDFEADALRGIAEYWRVSGDFQRAYSFCNDALRITSDTGNLYVEAQTHVALVRLGEAQRDTRLAEQYAIPALELTNECLYRVEASQINLSLGRLAQIIGDLPAAKRYVKTAQEILNLSDHYWVIKELESVIQRLNEQR